MKFKLMMCLLMASMVVMAGCGSKNEDTPKTSGSDVNTTTTTDNGNQDSGNTAAASTFSGDWEAEEESGFSPFFLKYGLNGLEEKNIDDVVIDDAFKVSDITDLSKVLSGYNYFTAADYSTEIYVEGADAFLNYDGEINSSATGDKNVMTGDMDVYMFKNEPDEKSRSYHGDLEIVVYNYTGEPLAWKDVIPLGVYRTGLNYGMDKERYANVLLNIDPDADPADFRNTMSDIVEVLGKPSHVYEEFSMHMNTGRDGEETFEETCNLGGGNLNYVLVYEREGYTLEIEVTEKNYLGSYEGNAYLSFYTEGAHHDEYSTEFVY